MSQLYEVLGLDHAATDQQISAALAEQRRTWRRRTTSPDITARQEAERRMHQLDEAERVLLDPQRRHQYDAVGSGSTSGEGQPGVASGEGKWVMRALQQLSRGQHGAAVFTAQRAIDEDPENAYAYSVLAEAAVAAGDEWLASESIDKALRLEPEDARLHAQRAGILVATNEPSRALAALRTAISLDPAQPEYQARLVQHLSEQGECDEAIKEGERAYQGHPDDAEVRNALATALAERAVLAQHELPDGRLVITTAAQASHVESLCERGLSVDAPDPAVNDDLSRQRGYARRAKRRKFSSVAFRRNYKWIVGLGLFALAGICCLPNMSGDNVDASTKSLGILLTVGVVGLFIGVLFFGGFEPQYVRNAALIERSVPRRMGRGPGTEEPGGNPTYAAVRQQTSEAESASKRHRAARRASTPPQEW